MLKRCLGLFKFSSTELHVSRASQTLIQSFRGALAAPELFATQANMERPTKPVSSIGWQPWSLTAILLQCDAPQLVGWRSTSYLCNCNILSSRDGCCFLADTKVITMFTYTGRSNIATRGFVYLAPCFWKGGLWFRRESQAGLGEAAHKVLFCFFLFFSGVLKVSESWKYYVMPKQKEVFTNLKSVQHLGA